MKYYFIVGTNINVLSIFTYKGKIKLSFSNDMSIIVVTSQNKYCKVFEFVIVFIIISKLSSLL